MDRFLLFAAGLCGALGVALAALAAHRSGSDLMTAAMFLLIHAPTFLDLSRRRQKMIGAAALGLIAGLVLFCGDLAARAFLGDRLFPYAAPLGGILIIASWSTIALSAVVSRRERA